MAIYKSCRELKLNSRIELFQYIDNSREKIYLTYNWFLLANHEVPVTEQQAKALATSLGAKGYIETSALTQRQLKDAFDNAIVYALARKRALSNNNNRNKTRKIHPRGRWRKLLCCLNKERE